MQAMVDAHGSKGGGETLFTRDGSTVSSVHAGACELQRRPQPVGLRVIGKKEHSILALSHILH